MATYKREAGEWLYHYIRTSDKGDVTPTARAEMFRYMGSQWWLTGLVLDHAKLLHRKVTAMGKELDARIDIGMADQLKRGHPWPIWPYFAIAQFDGDQLKQGFVLIPCAANYWLPTKIKTSDGVMKLPIWNGWGCLAPVKHEMEGSKGQPVEVTPGQLADTDTVRRGDCYILNLTARPVVQYQRRSLGVAVTFAQIDEAIDSVRCRLAFGMLPSA